MSRHLTPIVITIFVCTTLILGLATVQRAAESRPRTRLDIAKEQLKLARQAKEAIREGLMRPPRPGESTLISPTRVDTMMVWARREIEASIATGTREERLVALKNFKEEMRSFVEFSEKAFADSRLDLVTVLDAKYQVLQAELWIMEVEGDK
jgi:hypothetical protein